MTINQKKSHTESNNKTVTKYDKQLQHQKTLCEQSIIDQNITATISTTLTTTTVEKIATLKRSEQYIQGKQQQEDNKYKNRNNININYIIRNTIIISNNN